MEFEGGREAKAPFIEAVRARVERRRPATR